MYDNKLSVGFYVFGVNKYSGVKNKSIISFKDPKNAKFQSKWPLLHIIINSLNFDF